MSADQSTKSRRCSFLYVDVLGVCHFHSLYADHAPPFGPKEYGLYNLVSSVVSYLGLLSFGFGSAYVRFYSRYRVRDQQEEIAKLNGMFLLVFSVIGVVALLASSVMAANTERIFGDRLSVNELATARILMAIMVFNLATSFPASVFHSYITANEQYVFQKLLQIASWLTRCLFWQFCSWAIISGHGGNYSIVH